MGAGFEREQEVKMECFVGGFGGLERRRTGKRVCVVKAGLRDDLRRVGALTLAAGAMLFVPKGAVASNAGEGLLRDRRAGTELVAAVAPAEILDEKDMRIYENKRQLSNRKMTEYSGAQQELIELDTEWEQLWYIRFLQVPNASNRLPTDLCAPCIIHLNDLGNNFERCLNPFSRHWFGRAPNAVVHIRSSFL
mmetsp:Transcript_36597/g.146265  ORF Transcript_36597/g.146265 Transcript_36597/m.146265 type:complete len:193 (+) Transcript_36597:400-978(+)